MAEMLSNRFQVLSELGRGGMGTVYRVLDTLQGDREVALKTIQGQHAIGEESRLRFKEEFLAMVRLRHPNTIEVYDYGQLDQQTQFLTMEVVEGAELKELIGPPLPLDKVYSLLIQLLQALGFIHSRNYVHRDIKPENIRIRSDGTLKLMDFGLMDPLGQVSTGRITGTPGYLPPEVVKGGVIDASSDLYSLGCLAFELLTGRLPFSGSLIEVIRAHVDQEPPPLLSWRPDVPQRLEDIVERLLEKDQGRRYQHASDVIADLSELSGFQVSRHNLEQKKSYLTSSTLVARDTELAALHAALRAIQDGGGRSVFVGALAGAGKTRLVSELILRAKLDGFLVLRGQCLEAGMGAYDTLGQVLRALLPTATSIERQSYGPALARLLPELPKQGIVPLPPLEPALEKIRISESAAAWLRSASAREPLVLHLEDLHWIDPQSLDVFNQCIRWLTDCRVLCLATFRSDEVPTGSPVWYTIEEKLTSYLSLSNFDQPQTRLLLRELLKEFRISGSFFDGLYSSTAGNAFFVTEVLRYLMEEGLLTLRDGVWWFPDGIEDLHLPTSVEATVLRRLAQLGPEARLLARVASVLGRYQERAVLLHVSGIEEDAFFSGLNELTERQFILKEGSRYTFQHDRVRESLYADIPADEARSIHQRCGECLEKNKKSAISELAHHFNLGTDQGKAFNYLQLAAQEALTNDAAPIAVKNWNMARSKLVELDIPDKEAILAALLWRIGYHGYVIWPQVGIDAFEELISLLNSKYDAARMGGALASVARVIVTKRPQLARRAMRALLSGKPYDHRMWGDKRRLSLLHQSSWLIQIAAAGGLLAVAYGLHGQPAKGLERFAATPMPYKGSPMDAALQHCQTNCLCVSGRLDESLDVMRRCRALVNEAVAATSPTLYLAWIGMCGVSTGLAFQGIRPPQDDLDYVLRRLSDLKHYFLMNFYLSRLALWHTWAGRSEEALELFDEMSQNSRRGSGPPERWVHYMRPYLLWQQGEFEEALSLAHKSLLLPSVAGDGFLKQFVYILLGSIYQAQGSFGESREYLQLAEKHARDHQMHLVLVRALIGQAELAIALEDFTVARDHLEEALRITASGSARNPLHQAIAERLLGAVMAVMGRFEAAAGHFQSASSLLSSPEIDNPIELGHLYRAIGEMHLAMGQRDEARRAFTQSSGYYHHLKNRYCLSAVSARLEELLASPGHASQPGGDVQVEVPIPPRSQTLDTFRERLLTTSLDQTYVEICRSVVEACLESMGAEEGAILALAPERRCIATCTRDETGRSIRINDDVVDRVRDSGEGLVYIDLPADMVFASGHEVDIPSVLLAPLRISNRSFVIYLLKRDLASPFDADDLAALNRLCDVMVETLGNRLAIPPSEVT